MSLLLIVALRRHCWQDGMTYRAGIPETLTAEDEMVGAFNWPVCVQGT